VLECFRANNWVFLGVPTAQVIAAVTVVAAATILAFRHSSATLDRAARSRAPIRVGDPDRPDTRSISPRPPRIVQKLDLLLRDPS
jgi:hypothetical protein